MSARIESLALAGMAFGVATMLQPWWAGGMRAGFFLTLGCTLLQIAAAHARKAGP